MIGKRISGRPQSGEFASYAKADIDYVQGDDAVAVLRRQERTVLAVFESLDELQAGFRYAPGKWTLKEVLGHLCDDERIFAYRALCIARGDARPLPGFDENDYMAASTFDTRTVADLLNEYRTVRAASITLFDSLNEEAWLRRGIVNGYEASVRGLTFHVAGHELHHLRVIRDKYLV